MGDERDVAAFDARADRYDGGWLGRFHHEIAERVAALAQSTAPAPRQILDVGCGTGHLLGLLAPRYLRAEALVGIDASAAMVNAGGLSKGDKRVQLREGRAEQLPFEDGQFDLVVSTTSFDHWTDQAAGLRECARVLDHGGALVLADLFSPLLAPTLLGSRRAKARTKPRVRRLLAEADLEIESWHKVQPFIRAFVARRR